MWSLCSPGGRSPSITGRIHYGVAFGFSNAAEGPAPRAYLKNILEVPSSEFLHLLHITNKLSDGGFTEGRNLAESGCEGEDKWAMCGRKRSEAFGASVLTVRQTRAPNLRLGRRGFEGCG